MTEQKAKSGREVFRPLLLTVFVLLQVFLIAFPRHDTLDLEAWPNTSLSPRLSGDHTVGQSFVPGLNGLSRIDVFLATYTIKPRGDVIFRLYEGDPAGRPVAEVRAAGSKLMDNLFNPFEFRRLSRSGGKRFSFTLSMPGAAETEGPSVWMNPADLQPRGTLIIDGRQAEGDAVFRTYSRRTILAEWGRIARGMPGPLGNPIVLALAAIFFEIAAAAAFWRILGLFFGNGEAARA